MQTLFKLLASALILLTVTAPSFAVSESGVVFLLISPGARAAGMGEAFVGLADDATAVYWNPAGLAFQTGKEITLMHANWLPQFDSDLTYEFAAYRHTLEGIGTLGANVTFQPRQAISNLGYPGAGQRVLQLRDGRLSFLWNPAG